MTQLIVPLQPAPSTPLNLGFGVIYAPRVPTLPFAGFEAVEIAPNEYIVRAYSEDGTHVVTYRGDLFDAYRRLAAHLRMDVEAA